MCAYSAWHTTNTYADFFTSSNSPLRFTTTPGSHPSLLPYLTTTIIKTPKNCLFLTQFIVLTGVANNAEGLRDEKSQDPAFKGKMREAKPEDD